MVLKSGSEKMRQFNVKTSEINDVKSDMFVQISLNIIHEMREANSFLDSCCNWALCGVNVTGGLEDENT